MKTNGVKIFACYTIVLFLCVLGLSKLFVKAAPAAEPPVVSEPADVVAEPEVKEILPEKDPPEADNTWAVFLVNQKNGLPADYGDKLETALVYESYRDYYMDARVQKYVTQMFEDAQEAGIDLVMVSAYRDVEQQEKNFRSSVQDRIDNRGMTEEEAYEDTLSEVAPAGHSEHNSGLAADIMVSYMTDMSDDGFKDTEAYEWLKEHCADYGFVVRYPEGKTSVTGYKFEPWHYRFVGKYYARYMTEKGITLEELFEEKHWLDEEGRAIYHNFTDTAEGPAAESTVTENTGEEDPERSSDDI